MKYLSFVLISVLLVGCGSGESTGPVTERERLEVLLSDARTCTDEPADQFVITPEAVPVLDQDAYNTALSAAFITAARTQPCVFELPSGLNIRIDRAVEDAEAQSPRSGEMVTVNYEGRHIDGSTFDSSYARGTPNTFPSDRLIAGWIEALQLMRVGEEWTLYIPAALAYGEVGTPGGPIGPNEALTFRLELLGIASNGAPSAPDDEPDSETDTDSDEDNGEEG